DKARYFNVNVSDEAAVSAAIDQAHDFLGGLNVAMNCAGIVGSHSRGQSKPSPPGTYTGLSACFGWKPAGQSKC
ncbi:hypothetical protein ABGA94_05130, partial [Stenotrophomonas sp. 3diitr2024]